MAHLVKCRICGTQFDINATPSDQWIMPSKNYYYHSKCYNDWKVSSVHDDIEWEKMIYDFIARDLKVKYDYFLCEAQRKKYIKDRQFTNKGIYYTLKYFYEVKGGDWSKGHGGIGIVDYTYNDAVEYWVALERQKSGTLAALEAQMRARYARPEKTVVKPHKRKNRDKWSLDALEG